MGRGAIASALYVLLGDCCDTLMWILGNCMVDPRCKDYVVGLCGESMSGKSSIMRFIGLLFGSSVCVLPLTCITSKTAPTFADLGNAPSSRVCVSGDIDFSETVFPTKCCLKALTGELKVLKNIFKVYKNSCDNFIAITAVEVGLDTHY